MSSVIDVLIFLWCSSYLIASIYTSIVPKVSTVEINKMIQTGNLLKSLDQNLTIVNSENTTNMKEPNDHNTEWNIQIKNTNSESKERGNQTVCSITFTTGRGHKNRENLDISRSDSDSGDSLRSDTISLTYNSTRVGTDVADSHVSNVNDFHPRVNQGANVRGIHHRVKHGADVDWPNEVQKDNSHRGIKFETNDEDYYDFGQAIVIAARVASRDAKAEAPVTTDTNCWQCNGVSECVYVRCENVLLYHADISPKGFACIEYKMEGESGKVTHRGECAYAESSSYDPCEEILRYKKYKGTIRNCSVCYSDGCNYELKLAKTNRLSMLTVAALLGFGTCCLCLAMMFICLRAKPYKRSYWTRRCKTPSCVCGGSAGCETGRGDAPSVRSSHSNQLRY